MVGAQIEAVVSRVLRDEVQLLDAVSEQGASFGDKISLWPAAVRATHAGDDAKAAWMVAAFGNFDVCKVARCETKTRGSVVGNVGGARGNAEQGRGAWNL